MTQTDPFARSALARPAWHRIVLAIAILAPLWLAIAWAMAIP